MEIQQEASSSSGDCGSNQKLQTGANKTMERLPQPQEIARQSMDTQESNKRMSESKEEEEARNKSRRKDEDEVMREEGESRGYLSKEMDIDNVNEEMWERIKQVRRTE